MNSGCRTVRHFADWPEQGRSSDDRRRRPSSDQRRRFTSALQLVQSVDHEFGLLRGGVAHHQLSTSSTPLYRTVLARLNAFRPSALIERLPEGLDRVRRHRHFALIVDSPTAEYVTTRRPCDLYATDPFLDAVAYGFALGRGADELRAGINRQLVRLRRKSVLQNLYLRWWRTECATVEQWPATRPRTDHSVVPPDRSRHRDRHTDRSSHHPGGGSGAIQQYAMLSTVVSAYLVTTL